MRRALLLLTLISLAGSIIAGSLSLQHLAMSGQEGGMDVCGLVGGGCSAALASADAYVAGIPIAFLGFGWWSGLLLMTLLALGWGREHGGWPARPWPQLLALISTIALLPAGFFSLKLLGAAGYLGETNFASGSYPLCPLCISSHSLSLAFWLVSLVLLVASTIAEKRASSDVDLPAAASNAGSESEDDSLADWRRNPLPSASLLAALMLVFAIAFAFQTRTRTLELGHREAVIDRLRELPGANEIIAVNEITSVSAEVFRQITADLPPPSIGPADAPAIIRDFIDLNCSHCVESIARLRAFADAYHGKLRLEIFHFPGNHECNDHFTGMNGTAHACNAARAAVAAFHVGETYEERNANYWKMVDYILGRFPRLNGVVWTDAAEELGLGREAFEAAQTSDTAKTYLLRDTDLGGKVPVTGFPTIVLEDQVLSHRISDHELRALIDAQIVAAGDTPPTTLAMPEAVDEHAGHNHGPGEH